MSLLTGSTLLQGFPAHASSPRPCQGCQMEMMLIDEGPWPDLSFSPIPSFTSARQWGGCLDSSLVSQLISVEWHEVLIHDTCRFSQVSVGSQPGYPGRPIIPPPTFSPLAGDTEQGMLGRESHSLIIVPSVSITVKALHLNMPMNQLLKKIFPWSGSSSLTLL